MELSMVLDRKVYGEVVTLVFVGAGLRGHLLEYRVGLSDKKKAYAFRLGQKYDIQIS